jgi:hypothetical protein
VGSGGHHSIIGAASVLKHRKRSLDCAAIDEVMYFFAYCCFFNFRVRLYEVVHLCIRHR